MTFGDYTVKRVMGEIRLESAFEMSKLAQDVTSFFVDDPGDSWSAGSVKSRVGGKETELTPSFTEISLVVWDSRMTGKC